MFLQKAPRIANIVRASCTQRHVPRTQNLSLKRSFLLPLSLTRHFHPSFCNAYTTIPSAKDADSIIPVLDTMQTKTTESCNQLLRDLASKGRSAQAQTLYDAIFRDHTVEANLETYSQLMLAYINDGKFEDAMDIYYEIRDHEDSTSSSKLRFSADTYAAMISSLTDSKNVDLSNERAFGTTAEPMYAYTIQDGDSGILHNLEGNSQPSLLTALTLFNDMRHLEIRPTHGIYADMLNACAEQQDDFVLEKLHKLIRMDMYFDPDIQVYNGLMKAYQAVRDGASVLEIWDVAESSRAYDDMSVSIVLKTCLDHGYYTRANAIWNTLNVVQPQVKLAVQDFNNYLECILLNGDDMEKAQQVLEKGLSSGEANETSVNILEKYNNKQL